MKNTTPANLADTIHLQEPQSNGKPIPQLIAELRQFGSQFPAESVRFTSRGLKLDFLAVATVLADLLEQRESIWVNGRVATPESKAIWKALSEQGYICRDNLLEDLELALMDNPDALRALAEIRKGEGPEDMILDIAKLVELAKQHAAEVTASGITAKMLADATDLDKRLAEAFAATTGSGATAAALKLERDKARTFAVNYTSLIRRYADTIYRDEPEKRALFVSNWSKENNKRAKEAAKAQKEAEQAAAAENLETN